MKCKRYRSIVGIYDAIDFEVKCVYFSLLSIRIVGRDSVRLNEKYTQTKVTIQ